MNLLRVAGHHFLPFKDFDLDLSKDGVYNIVGKNGSGKSSIREAITWCLWGKSRADGAGDDLIHNDEEDMWVLVEFSTANNKRYRVTRSRDRGTSTSILIEEM